MTEMVVHKHELGSVTTDLELVLGAEVLHVDAQARRIQLWERHSVAEHRTSIRRFRVVGTGHAFPAGGVHVGSLLADGGALVFHVFEEPR